MERVLETLTATTEMIDVPGRVMAVANNRVRMTSMSGAQSGNYPHATTVGDAFLSPLIGCGTVIVDAVARDKGISMQKARFPLTDHSMPTTPRTTSGSSSMSRSRAFRKLRPTSLSPSIGPNA